MERQFDVIVVGGGTAGFAAAVTAARGGAKTLLIEEKAYLGGTATGAQVSMFMGFADGEPDRPQQGIIKDVMDGLAAAGGTPGIETIYLCGRRDLDIPVIPYESEILKDLIFDLVDQAGVERFCRLDAAAAKLLRQAVNRFRLSMRGYGRIRKVARTVADLAGHEAIEAQDVALALQFRTADGFYGG